MEIKDDLTEISKFQRDPTIGDDEKGTNGIIFRRGALWLNESSGAFFGFTDSTKGSMQWKAISHSEITEIFEAEVKLEECGDLTLKTPHNHSLYILGSSLVAKIKEVLIAKEYISMEAENGN